MNSLGSQAFVAQTASARARTALLGRCRAWIELDVSALAANVRAVRSELAQHVQLYAVVKADAYGHGAAMVAPVALAAGASGLCVATVGEGISLREAGIEAPILLLGTIITELDACAIVDWNLTPTLSTVEQAECLERVLAARGQRWEVHLKFDTGMGRLGCPLTGAASFIHSILRMPYISIVGAYSHLACAGDERLDEVTRTQAEAFAGVVDALREAEVPVRLAHLSNSAGMLSSPRYHFDMVRVGLALYGIGEGPLASRLLLRPPLSVKARVEQVKMFPAGVGISYGHTFKTTRSTRVAIVSIGYADGVPRGLSNRMSVGIRGKRCPQVGTITMDHLTADVSDIPDVAVGDVVTLIGRDGDCEFKAHDWAHAMGTIPYEVMCAFSPRLPRMGPSSVAG